MVRVARGRARWLRVSPPGYLAQFTAVLDGLTQGFDGTTVWETLTHSGDRCWYEGAEGPFDLGTSGGSSWNVDIGNSYGADTIGIEGDLYPANYYQSQIAIGLAPGIHATFLRTRK